MWLAALSRTSVVPPYIVLVVSLVINRWQPYAFTMVFLDQTMHFIADICQKCKTKTTLQQHGLATI